MHSQLIPPSNILQLFIMSRPSVHRPLVSYFHYIHKPRLLQQRLAIPPYREALAKFFAHSYNCLTPGVVEVVFRHAAIIRDRLDAVLDDFNPATGLHAAVCFAEEEVPVRDAAKEFADMDEVEFGLGERPVEGHIVDLEVAVGRYPFGLDRGEVCANYCCAGVGLEMVN